MQHVPEELSQDGESVGGSHGKYPRHQAEGGEAVRKGHVHDSLSIVVHLI